MEDAGQRPANASFSLSLPSRQTLIALIVATAFFMENLDGTVIATALPAMAVSLGTGAIQLSIGITAYLLTLAIFIPASGWLADRFGTRDVFCAAIAVFTLASIACGLSPDFYSFVAARIVQGAAAALMSPVGRLVVLRSTEKRDLLRAAAITVWPGLIAPVIGPPLGGFITTFASWRWIFYLNIPLGLIGAVLVLRYVGNHRAEKKLPFDFLGFALTGLTLASLIYGFERIGMRDWTNAAILIVAGIAFGAFALRHARRCEHPLIELSPFGVTSFWVAASGGLLFRMAVGSTPVLLPLMFQRGWGLSAFQAGVLTLSYALGNLGIKPLTTRILRLGGFRGTLVIDGFLSAIAILACGFLPVNSSDWIVWPLLIAAGVFRSTGLTALFTLPFVDLAPHQKSAATTVMSVVQQVGYGLGVAFGSVALQASLLLRGAGSDALTMTDFRFAFAAVAIVALLALPQFLRLHPTAGAEVSGHSPRNRN